MTAALNLPLPLARNNCLLKLQFSEKARELENWFKEKGHAAQGSIFIDGFLGLDDTEKEKLKLKQKYEQDAIKEHWKIIENAERSNFS